MELHKINQVAKQEGWGLFFCYGSLEGTLQIQKYDEETIFKNDLEAIKFVSNLAELGSYVHQQALLLAKDILINH